MEKQPERIKAVEVQLRVPPGDYTDTSKNEKLARALSSDITEFFRATDNPKMFYVAIKHYLSERIGLRKMMPGNSLIESSIHATIVTLMTEIVATGLYEVANDMEDKPHKKFIGSALRNLKQILKSEQRMKDFDKVCFDSYGIHSENISNLDDVSVDTHLNAKS